MKTYTLEEIKRKHLGEKKSFLRNVQELYYLLLDIQMNFQNIRKQNNLTKKEMAELLDLSVYTINNLENNIDKISIDKILDVINELETKNLIK